MKGYFKKSLALITIIAMIIAYVPINISEAVDYNTIQFNQGVRSIDEVNNASNMNVNIDDDNYLIIDGTNLTSNAENKRMTTTGNNITFSANVEEGKQLRVDCAGRQLVLRNHDVQNLVLDYSEAGYYQIDVIKEDLEDDHSENPGPAGGPDEIAFDISFQDTHMIASINNVIIMDDFDGVLKNEFKGSIKEAGFAQEIEYNVFRFQNVFGDAPVREFVINGVTYKDGVEGFEESEDGSVFITVPGAEKYVITGEADSEFVVPRTIIWVNPDYVARDEEDARWVSDFTIEHGYAKVIEIYNKDGELLDPDEYIGEHADQYGLDNGFGWVMVYPGYRVIFEFTPEYGYQLTDIKINETPIEDAIEATNQYEVILPEDSGNLHFAATFTKTADIVKANTNKVSEGTVNLAGGLDAGTAQLNVSDANISAEKKAAFEAAAGDYTIENYLDIGLYQVFYKGKADSNDVWSNKIEVLQDDATISIKLADGMTADDIVLVHNIHNGEQFEVIQIESYDKETNTITFKTKSFSNYAIATKNSNSKVVAKENTEVNKKAAEEVSKLVDEIVDGKTVKGIDEELAAKIKAAVEAGKEVKVEVSTKQVEAKDIKDDVIKVEALLKDGNKVVMYYDIDVLVQIDGETVGTVTELGDKIKLSVPVPTNLPEVADGYVREFTVVRVHNGVAEKLDTTVVGDVITFLSADFSTYALTYEDVKVTVNPKTGDNIILISVIFTLSTIAFIATKKLKE